MNKEELIKATSQEAGLTQAVARKCIDAVFKVITNTLKRGEEVRLVGFGTFRVK
ncbi:MAG: HU family DNA-binding protein, partial [Candidatus Aenigmatarchaeota archaeon]